MLSYSYACSTAVIVDKSRCDKTTTLSSRSNRESAFKPNPLTTLTTKDAPLFVRTGTGGGKGPPPLVVNVGEERDPIPVVDCGNVELDLSLPQCYSSTAADPSQGRWIKCAKGMDASPTNTGSGPFKTGQTAKR